MLLVATTAYASTLRRQFLHGVTCGLIYFGGTLYWVSDTMRLHGGLPLFVSAPVAALLVAYLSIYVGVFALVLGGVVRRYRTAGIWFAPLIWVAAEWARSHVGVGFPWVPLGASQATVLPIVQTASVVGVYGLSALVALVSTAAAAVVASPTAANRRAAAGVAVLLVAVTVAGAWRATRSSLLDSGRAARIGLVQGNVAQDQKWDPAFRGDILTRYLALSRQVIADGAEIVIWPEASTPFSFDVAAPLAAPIRELAASTETPFILGSDHFEAGAPGEPPDYYNAAVLVGPDGTSRQWYRKMQLVPFGEYVPLRSLLFFVGPLVEAVGEFSAGTEAVVFDAEGRRVSVAICYESVYPGIARQFVQNGSELLATITNDAWFGRSSAAYQHFQQGAIRAVEQGRFVVRSANTGISGAVDPYGRVLAATDLFEPAAVTVDVRLLTDRTIYSYTGDLVVWCALAVTLLLAAQMIAERRPAQRGPRRANPTGNETRS